MTYIGRVVHYMAPFASLNSTVSRALTSSQITSLSKYFTSTFPACTTPFRMR